MEVHTSMLMPVICTMNAASMYFADLQAKCILIKLPLPNAFNQWLSDDYFIPHNDHLPDAKFQWGGIASNKVLCTMQKSIITVSLHIQYIIQFNSTHNLSSIQMTFSQTSKCIA